MPRYEVEYNGVTTIRREFPDSLGDVKGADTKTEFNATTGEVTKLSDTDAMMQALQGELTESVLDAATKKAKAK